MGENRPLMQSGREQAFSGRMSLTAYDVLVTAPGQLSGVLRSVSVCVSVCLSVREHISGTAGPIFTNFASKTAVAVARSSASGVALRYVLPVL